MKSRILSMLAIVAVCCCGVTVGTDAEMTPCDPLCIGCFDAKHRGVGLTAGLRG